jgi:hypothetical protein
MWIAYWLHIYSATTTFLLSIEWFFGIVAMFGSVVLQVYAE